MTARLSLPALQHHRRTYHDIGAATEFTFAIAAGTGTASGTITATLDDQFNFAYEPEAGSVTISAQLMSLTNADKGNGTPQAGVMVRAAPIPTTHSSQWCKLAGQSGPRISYDHRRRA